MKKILDACCGSKMFWFDKENEEQIKLKDILKVIEYKPLFGNKRSKTHWLVFMK